MIIVFDSKRDKNSKAQPSLTTSTNETTFSINNNDCKPFQSTKRSKHGCVTCKTRKKKCDEMKPICSECLRLNKECIWIDYDRMDPYMIRRVKDAVEKSESSKKLRRRKKNRYQQSNVSLPMIKSKSPDISNLIHNDMSEVFETLSPDNDIKYVPPQVIDLEAGELDNEAISSHNETGALVNTNNYSTGLLGKFTGTSDDFMTYWKDLNEEFPIDFQIQSPNSPEYLQAYPKITYSPHPAISSPLNLSDRALYLYNYYVVVLSSLISVAPRSNNNRENYYQNVFLPLAHENEGIMYGLLAWASFHMKQTDHRTDDNSEALEYLEKALRYLENMKLDDKISVINKLALLLVVTAAEICRGDVKRWITHMNVGSKLLSMNGGLHNFTNTKQEFWLVANFAYHDVLASDATKRGIYFASDQYKEIFEHDFSSGIYNPIVGIAKDLYACLAEIANLSYEVKRDLQELSELANDKHVTESPQYEFVDDNQGLDTESHLSDHSRVNKLLLSVVDRARELETKIDVAKPNKEELIGLNEEEFEWQITLFETFKLSAKLYLRQAIFKCNPSTIESQILTNDLAKCLDIILGSPVESALLFPVFIAAIHCVTTADRQLMIERIERFISTYGPWSVVRAKEVIEKIWKINPGGDKYIDWRETLDDLGWEINFA